MLILHPKFPILPPISAKITRNHTGFFRFTECGMPDLRRKTEGALFKDCSQNHTTCDRNVCKSKGYMISTWYLCILYYYHARSGMKEVPCMNYEIRHYDTPLLRFSATEDTAKPETEILWINENARQLIPLDMKLTTEGVASWLKHRLLPRNRAYAHNLLSKCGLNFNRPMSIVRVSKALSRPVRSLCV